MLGKVKSEEAFTRKKPSMSHFRIFHNLVYYQASSNNRKKQGPTTKKGFFVGYNETSKACKVYIPTLRKTVIKHDVKFEEERALNKSFECEQGAAQEQQAPK